MKKKLFAFLLRQLLVFVFGDRTRASHAVALAEASYEEGDKAFSRRGRVYRFIKEGAPTEMPKYLLDLGTELAQTIDELDRSK